MQKLEDLDFADDVSLLSHMVGYMQAKTKRLCNITKTKSMEINASQKAPLTVDGQATEEVNCFTHLGSIVSILRQEAQLKMLSKLDLGTLRVIKYN